MGRTEGTPRPSRAYFDGMRLVAAIAVALAVAGTSAMEFPPGELMVCGATQCRVVTDAQSRAFSALLWGNQPVARAPTPRVGAPIFQLRFKSGPAGVIISATAIRVHGLNCGRFRRGTWYRLPASLRGLGAGLEPKHLRASIPRSC
jgi:hypothetical protein